SDDLLGGSISRNSTAKIHGTANLLIAAAYNWENQRLRPYITLTDQTNGESYRWDLGVYLPETPMQVVGESPAVYEIEAYDKLIILDTPYGASYRIAASTSYVTAVQTLLDAAGVVHSIDTTEAATTLPTDLVWEISDKNTYLSIVNDLLEAIGYVSLYTDRSGIFRSEPWTAPSGRSVVHHYLADSDETIVARMGASQDLFDVPNKWVFVRNNPDPGETLPSEGAGIYTVTNQSNGISSIDSRGRTKTRVLFLDAANHASLVAIGDKIVERDRHPSAVVQVSSRTNPEHWHESTVKVTSSELGYAAKTFTEEGWTLPLTGEQMEHELMETVT
ncbi:MAG TPA: hypothetical protein VLA34_13580, partial [Candidatus Krumholzibacterium sp.]|nr:hypothetical protein [Candidatus Krumholzibacterium sp.]